MADGFTVDFSDVIKLEADISAAPAKVRGNVVKAVTVTAHKVDDAWSESLSGSATVPGGPASITYDIKISKDEIGAEIGPELKGQGPIVGMLEYGTPHTGPTGYGAAALQKNEGDFADGLSKALGDAL